MRKATSVAVISVFAVAVAQLACLPLSGRTPAPTPPAPPAMEATSTRPIAPVDVEPTKSPVVTAEGPSLPDRPLADSGPWYVFMAFSSVHELWALNGDGSGLTLLTSDLDQTTGAVNASYSLWPAPQAGRVAIVQVDDRFAQSVPMLKLLELPSGDVRTIAPLLENSDAYQRLDLDAQTQVWAAVGVLNRPAWSPDGRWLAFNAAIDGPSADVYVCDTSTGKIQRLTDGPDQSVDLAWSPDNGYVVHGVARSLYYGYSGLGYDMLGAWAVPPDPISSAIRLYDHAFHGYEELLGWLDDGRYLADSLDGESLGNCGYFNLRTVDIQDGEGPVLLAGNYSRRAFDPRTRTILLVLTSTLSQFDCRTSLDAGVYLFDVDSQRPRLVPEVDPEPVMGASWSEEAGLFFLSGGEELLAIDPDGNVARYPSIQDLYEAAPVVAPGGQMWVLANAYDGTMAVGTRAGQLINIEAEAPVNPFWSADGAWLFFFDGGIRLYAAPAPDFDALVLIGEGLLSAGSPVIANP